jgi:hypothetical protein
MNKLILFISFVLLSLGLSAQASKTAQQIKWTVVAKKTGANTAEVYFKATLDTMFKQMHYKQLTD